MKGFFVVLFWEYNCVSIECSMHCVISNGSGSYFGYFNCKMRKESRQVRNSVNNFG